MTEQTQSKALNGVYCVYLDADIVGYSDPVAWTFAYEGDADTVQTLLEAIEGPGRSWGTFEPTSYTLDDDDLRQYLVERTGLTLEQLAAALDAIENDRWSNLKAVLAEAGYDIEESEEG